MLERASRTSNWASGHLLRIRSLAHTPPLDKADVRWDLCAAAAAAAAATVGLVDDDVVFIVVVLIRRHRPCAEGIAGGVGATACS